MTRMLRRTEQSWGRRYRLQAICPTILCSVEICLAMLQMRHSRCFSSSEWDAQKGGRNTPMACARETWLADVRLLTFLLPSSTTQVRRIQGCSGAAAKARPNPTNSLCTRRIRQHQASSRCRDRAEQLQAQPRHPSQRCICKARVALSALCFWWSIPRSALASGSLTVHPSVSGSPSPVTR